MPRIKSDFRITIKDNNTGGLHKIELIKLPTTDRRYWVSFDGKYSEKINEASITQVCDRLRKLMRIMSKRTRDSSKKE